MLNDIITDGCMIADFKSTSKKQVLQNLSEKLAEQISIPSSHILANGASIESRKIFEALLDRERLGSTGVGKGVAIPHARLPELKKIKGLFARLDTPIDFGSIDDLPVDLIFVLLAPQDAGASHLQALSRISRLMRQKEILEQLRSATSCQDIKAVISPSLTIAA